PPAHPTSFTLYHSTRSEYNYELIIEKNCLSKKRMLKCSLYILNKRSFTMCGFVALYNKKNHPISHIYVNQMTSLITHRGPYDYGTHIDRHVGLGFRQLNMIDFQGRKRTFCNKIEDISVTFDGELYND